jgi:hypothetical protein
MAKQTKLKAASPGKLTELTNGKKKKKEYFLPTANELWLKETPTSRRRKFSLQGDNVRQEKRDSYLLIGFDTEFQTPSDPVDNITVQEGRARYEVLS